MGKHHKKNRKHSKCCRTSSSESDDCEIRIIYPNDCQPRNKCSCNSCSPCQAPCQQSCNPCQTSCQSACSPCNPDPCCQDPCSPCSPCVTLTGTKTVSPATPVPGAAAIFTITVNNPSACSVSGVVLTDILQTNLFVPGTIVVSPAGTIVGNTVTVNLGTINPGGSVIVTISGTVSPSFTGAVTNTATITACGLSSPVNIPLGAGSGGGGATGFTVSKVFSSPTVVAGGSVNFVITVTNNTATPITFLLADALVGLNATITAFVSPLGTVVGVIPGVNLTVTGITLNPGESTQITGTVTVAAPGAINGTVIVNLVTVIPLAPLGLPIIQANAIVTVIVP